MTDHRYIWDRLTIQIQSRWKNRLFSLATIKAADSDALNLKVERKSRKLEKERKEKRKKGDSRECYPSNRNTSWVGLEPTVPIHLADESHSHYPNTPPDRP